MKKILRNFIHFIVFIFGQISSKRSNKNEAALKLKLEKKRRGRRNIFLFLFLPLLSKWGWYLEYLQVCKNWAPTVFGQQPSRSLCSPSKPGLLEKSLLKSVVFVQSRGNSKVGTWEIPRS